MRHFVKLLLICVCSISYLCSAEDENSLSGKSFTPAATGAAIVYIEPDSTAATVGLVLDDIITQYGTTAITDTPDLINAIDQAKTPKSTVTFFHHGVEKTIEVPQGKLGVQTMAVTKGQHMSLPPATEVILDTKRFSEKPGDTWYKFIIDGKHVGAEHTTISRAEDKLTVSVEVLFDGGEKWGLNHMWETGIIDVSKSTPRVISMRHEGPLWKNVGTGRWIDDTTWELTVKGIDDEGKNVTETETCKITDPLINDYSYLTLAATMPTKPGTCWHMRTVPMHQATPTGWSAVLVIGPETIHIDGQAIEATRMEHRSLMSTGWVMWVQDGRPVQMDYSGGKGTTLAQRCSREEALKGLHADLKPLSDKQADKQTDK